MSNVHEIEITDLKPGNVYDFHVVVENDTHKNYSFASTFKVINNSQTKFSFGFFGDSRGDNCMDVGTDSYPPGGDAAFESMINQMVSKGTDFIIIAGDDIQTYGCSTAGEVKQGWVNFHNLASGARGFLSTPILSSTGNHELGNSGISFYNTALAAYQDYWIAPLNGDGATGPGGTLQWEETSYSWRYGNSLFIFVNTEESDNRGNITRDQFDWFNQTLRQDYTHKFVIGHRPLAGTSRDDCLFYKDSASSDRITRLMYYNNVTASLFAHEHYYNYNTTQDGNMINIISGGAGAPISNRYCFPTAKGYCIEHQWHYIIFDVDGDIMNATVYNVDGDIIHEFGRDMSKHACVPYCPGNICDDGCGGSCEDCDIGDECFIDSGGRTACRTITPSLNPFTKFFRWIRDLFR